MGEIKILIFNPRGKLDGVKSKEKPTSSSVLPSSQFAAGALHHVHLFFFFFPYCFKFFQITKKNISDHSQLPISRIFKLDFLNKDGLANGSWLELVENPDMRPGMRGLS